MIKQLTFEEFASNNWKEEDLDFGWLIIHYSKNKPRYVLNYSFRAIFKIILDKNGIWLNMPDKEKIQKYPNFHDATVRGLNLQLFYKKEENFKNIRQNLPENIKRLNDIPEFESLTDIKEYVEKYGLDVPDEIIEV